MVAVGTPQGRAYDEVDRRGGFRYAARKQCASHALGCLGSMVQVVCVMGWNAVPRTLAKSFASSPLELMLAYTAAIMQVTDK